MLARSHALLVVACGINLPVYAEITMSNYPSRDFEVLVTVDPTEHEAEDQLLHRSSVS